MSGKKTTIVSVACGVLCAICILLYVGNVKAQAAQERADALARYGGEQVEILVATRDIAPGETIGLEDIETKLWVADLLPEDAVGDPSAIIGRSVTSSILKGEAISLRRFDSARMQLEVPAGLCAVSVAAKDVQAVGGAIGAGSYVDIYATGDTTTELLGEHILVLATSASDNESGEGSIAWITVAISPDKVQEMIAAANRTQLYFVLPGEPLVIDEQEAPETSEANPTDVESIDSSSGEAGGFAPGAGGLPTGEGTDEAWTQEGGGVADNAAVEDEAAAFQEAAAAWEENAYE